jgi:hypothetical protein
LRWLVAAMVDRQPDILNGYLPRWLIITHVFGAWCRMTLDEIGRQWGEAEWTATDLWRRA